MGSFWVIQCKRHYAPYLTYIRGRGGRGDTSPPSKGRGIGGVYGEGVMT